MPLEAYEADFGTTCCVSQARGADRLLTVGSQIVIARTLAGRDSTRGIQPIDAMGSVWALVGMSQWLESCFQGPPGRMMSSRNR